ncbi:hypothetical protein O181_104001 [Austropuccinia psidii MF-1]|uniref:Uncharacterized protein n=1 Tax=Austropuccinia psidii MF-1 TaxID=1389203 RepID=A0A9Q3JLF3_9BASI|nr:hypothetical protein [Austropuccinia psidii MF-1]
MIQTLEDMIRGFCAYGLEFKDSDGFTHVDIHPTESSCKIMLDKARHHANKCMQDSFKYEKDRWDKRHKPPDFKVGDLLLVSTPNFNNINSPKKLKDSFAGTFMIKALHGPDAVQLKLRGELMNKHPGFPEILIKL